MKAILIYPILLAARVFFLETKEKFRKKCDAILTRFISQKEIYIFNIYILWSDRSESKWMLSAPIHLTRFRPSAYTCCLQALACFFFFFFSVMFFFFAVILAQFLMKKERKNGEQSWQKERFGPFGVGLSLILSLVVLRYFFAFVAKPIDISPITFPF